MYFLPASLDLSGFSHVVLTPEGRLLAAEGGSLVFALGEEGVGAHETPIRSFACEYAAFLSELPEEEADCLGFGAKYGLPPVLLHLQMTREWGLANALFHRPPTTRHYELLRAVGVDYLGGYTSGEHFVASFRNYLPTHLHAGSLSGFSRTGLCNEFFFRHGEIDAELEAGLSQASGDRIGAARKRNVATLQQLAARACSEQLAMICHPPPPAEPFAYGDLVPLGFLLRTLKNDASGAAARLREKIAKAQINGLWPFHIGRLRTCTDSTLILQGYSSSESVSLLEEFADGRGGYFPQLWSSERESEKMLDCPETRHWCQADFATTCLVRSLRDEAKLTSVTSLAYLEDRFDSRAGLYFANPYIVDWSLAQAIRNDPGAEFLKAALRQEIIASRNKDYSYGTYDLALSTALAILALGAIGENGRHLRISQLRLLEMAQGDGHWPSCTPFYSSFRLDRQRSPGVQILEVGGETHELSLYVDEHHIIGTVLAGLALSEECSVEREEVPSQSSPHPRYQCRTVAEYVQRFALAPYVNLIPGVHNVEYGGTIC